MARSRAMRPEASPVRVLALRAAGCARGRRAGGAGRRRRRRRPRAAPRAPAGTHRHARAQPDRAGVRRRRRAAIVAVDSSSDFPAAARAIPRIGDVGPDRRRAAARPEARTWSSSGGAATPPASSISSRRAGLRLFRLEPQRLDDVVGAIERLGSCSAPRRRPGRRAAALRERARGAAPASCQGDPPVQRLLPGVVQPADDDQPQADRQRGDRALRRPQRLRRARAAGAAGGDRVGARRRPRGDLHGRRARQHGAAASRPRRAAPSPPGAAIRACAAVQGRWLYVLNGDAISRQGPRIVDGATAVCGALDEVRRERRRVKR